jgi:O-acetyl-ADP-ribose deacetylase (regulator of RNase III)
MPGDAMATPAFDLDPPIRHIIHTVGPVWEGGGYGEADVLASCYRRSLEIADGLRARSVAFPAIATGVLRVPARPCRADRRGEHQVYAYRSRADTSGRLRRGNEVFSPRVSRSHWEKLGIRTDTRT